MFPANRRNFHPEHRARSVFIHSAA